MRRLISWRGLGLWALLLAALLALALLKRHFELLALGERLARQLTPLAEGGGAGTPHDDWADPELDLYLYGDWSGPQPIAASQGPAIYLFNHGYRNPALLRAVLLLEARRCYDWQYTYSRVRNHDLRSGLILRCLNLYPDDLRVCWAAGQLELAAGDWEPAAEHLGRVVHECGEMPGLRDFGASIGRKGRNILGRYCAALTMCGRDAEAGALLEDWHTADENDRDVNWAYSHWLLDHGEYQAVLDLLTAPDSPQWPTPTLDAGLVYAAALEGLEPPSPVAEAALEASLKAAEDRLNSGTADWDEQLRLEAERCRLGSHLAQRWMQRGEWERAAKFLSDKRFETPWEPAAGAGSVGLQLLCALALGGPLELYGRPSGQFAGENELDEGGPFQSALAGEGLVATLRSPLLDAALRRRGVSFEQIQPELYAAIQPERDHYYDMSNGRLRPGW